jgi:hypothetical protein
MRNGRGERGEGETGDGRWEMSREMSREMANKTLRMGEFAAFAAFGINPRTVIRLNNKK